VYFSQQKIPNFNYRYQKFMSDCYVRNFHRKTVFTKNTSVAASKALLQNLFSQHGIAQITGKFQRHGAQHFCRSVAD